MLLAEFKNRINRVDNILNKIDVISDNDFILIRKVAKSALILGLEGLERPEVSAIIKAITFVLLLQTGISPILANTISAKISNLSQRCIDEVQNELQSSDN